MRHKTIDSTGSLTWQQWARSEVARCTEAVVAADCTVAEVCTASAKRRTADVAEAGQTVVQTVWLRTEDCTVPSEAVAVLLPEECTPAVGE